MPEHSARLSAPHRHTFSIAPMLKWTDRHYRQFARHISSHALLYTEMITAPAIIQGDREHHLAFDDRIEQPIALQLGGSEPKKMTEAAQIAEQYGYTEININCGCPSDRVQSGRFGACLMAEPQLVAENIKAMQAKISIPVTVKSRIGIDDYDSYEFLKTFTHAIQDAGCQTLIVHARKAWLKGLSPKQNREIPPLCYERVYQLKEDFPELTIVINGGIKTLAQCQAHLQKVDGVMVGREAYHDPYPLLSQVDTLLYAQQTPSKTRLQIAHDLTHYIRENAEQGIKPSYLTRHYLGLFHGLSGARAWRKSLSVDMCKNNAIETYLRALNDIEYGLRNQSTP